MSLYDADCELGCKLLKAERNKLEAVKEWYEHEADKKGDNPWWYDKRLRKLSKILEAEA